MNYFILYKSKTKLLEKKKQEEKKSKKE